MKRSTKELYDIEPEVLAKMTYEDALRFQRVGARAQLEKLVNRNIPLWDWSDADYLLHMDYVKAIEWCEAKLGELPMRMYNLEGKSILSLKQLRDLVAVNPDLTFEEKQANIRAIDKELGGNSIETALVEGSEAHIEEFD